VERLFERSDVIITIISIVATATGIAVTILFNLKKARKRKTKYGNVNNPTTYNKAAFIDFPFDISGFWIRSQETGHWNEMPISEINEVVLDSEYNGKCTNFEIFSSDRKKRVYCGVFDFSNGRRFHQITSLGDSK